MSKRRYKMSNRQRTALLGIGQHQKEIKKLFRENFGLEVEKIDFKKGIIKTNKDWYKILDTEAQVESFIENDILGNMQNFFEYSQDVYEGLSKIGMTALKKNLSKIVRKVKEEKMIHIKYEKSIMNKLGFGKNQFYLI